MRACVLLGVLICVACGSSEQGAVGPEPNTAEQAGLNPGPNCEERVSAFEARLATAPPTPGAFMEPPPGFQVLHGQGEPLGFLGPAVTIQRDGSLLYDGAPIVQAALQQRLDESRRNWSLLHPREPSPGIFFAWIDEHTKLGDAQRLLQSDQDWLLLVEDPSLRADPPVCPASLGERCQTLAEANQATRVMITRELVSGAVGRCQELVRMYVTIAEAAYDEKSVILRREMPIALRQCNCNADVDTLEYLTLEIFSLGAPVIRTIQVDQAASPDQTIGEYVAGR